MKNNLNEFPARYIVDESGKKTDVIMSVTVFEELMEKLEDLYWGVKAEQILASEPEYYKWEDVEKALFKDDKDDKE